ncbi:hypothetical protein N2152v2_002048 [Parachlorella kessleri]
MAIRRALLVVVVLTVVCSSSGVKGGSLGAVLMDTAAVPKPEDWLQAAVEAIGKRQEDLFGIADSVVPNLLDQVARQQAHPAATDSSGHQRKLHAVAAAVTLDSITSKMRQMSQDLIKMEIKDATQSVANSVRAAFGVATSNASSTTATTAAAQATANAAASLLLGTVQDALTNPAPAVTAGIMTKQLGSGQFLTSLLGGSSSSSSSTAPPSNSVAAALTSGTQLFANALNQASAVAAAAAGGSNGTGLSNPLAAIMGAVGQLAGTAGSGSSPSQVSAAAAATNLLSALASSAGGSGGSSSPVGGFLSQLLTPAAAGSGGGSSLLSGLSQVTPAGVSSAVQALLNPGTMASAAQSLLGTPTAQSATSALNQQAQTIMDVINQHNVDFASMFAEVSSSLTSAMADSAASTKAAPVGAAASPAPLLTAGAGATSPEGAASAPMAASTAADSVLPEGAESADTAATGAAGARRLRSVAASADEATRMQELMVAQELLGRYRVLKAHWERVVKPHNEHTRRALLSYAAEQQAVLGQPLVGALPLQGAPPTSPEPVLPPVPQATVRDIVTYAPHVPVLVSPTSAPPAAGPSPSQQLQPIGQTPLQTAEGSHEFDIDLVVPAYERVFGVRSSQSTMQPQMETVQVVLVQSMDALSAGQQVIDGLLGLLRDTVRMTLSAAAPPVQHPYALYQQQRPLVVVDDWQEAPWSVQPQPRPLPWNPQVDVVVEPSYGAAGMDDDSLEALFGSLFDAADQEAYEYEMRRRLQGAPAVKQERSAAGDQAAEDDSYSEGSYDDDYADDYSWLEGDEQLEPLVTPVLLGLAASSASGQLASPDAPGLPDVLLELVLHMATTVAGGDAASMALTTEQVQLLSDMLAEAAAAAADSDGGDDIISASSETVPGLPNFAVDAGGNSTSTGSGALSAIAAVVLPLSGLAQRPPAGQHGSSLMDSFGPKYWGLTISLAFVGMLLGAVAVAVVRRSSSSRLDRDDSYNHVPGVPQQTARQTPAHPSQAPATRATEQPAGGWVGVVHDKVAAQGGVVKKFSNLPA